jgi:hypothetical protein
MSSSPGQSRLAARSRIRSLVPTILTIMISIMIVRDILVRRWKFTDAARRRRDTASSLS